jgi:hypothetical protein
MRKISFWRYLAVNRTTLFAALSCALLVFSLLGCGAVKGSTNHLQSVQLSISSSVESPGNTINLTGIGGTSQLYVWGNYSNGKSQLLSGEGIQYHIVLTPGSQYSTLESPYTQLGDPNANPAGTIQMSSTGLLTAVTPFACTWGNSAVPPATSPAWGVIGSYTVTITTQGMTSQPAYVVVSSEGGITDTTNPTGECGPPPAS